MNLGTALADRNVRFNDPRRKFVGMKMNCGFLFIPVAATDYPCGAESFEIIFLFIFLQPTVSSRRTE